MNKITKMMLVLLMLGAAAIVAGCGEKDVEPTLIGSWQLEAYVTLEGDIEVPVYFWTKSYTVTFNSNGTIAGFASNNASQGTFVLNTDDALKIKFQQVTKALELDGEKFLDAINNADSYTFDNRNLLLYYNSGQNFMRFKPWRRQDN